MWGLQTTLSTLALQGINDNCDHRHFFLRTLCQATQPMCLTYIVLWGWCHCHPQFTMMKWSLKKSGKWPQLIGKWWGRGLISRLTPSPALLMIKLYCCVRHSPSSPSLVKVSVLRQVTWPVILVNLCLSLWCGANAFMYYFPNDVCIQTGVVWQRLTIEDN